MAYREADPSARVEGPGNNYFWKVPGDAKKWVSTRIRIMPPREDHPNDSFYLWQAVHRGLPGSQRSVLCPAKMTGKPCPACNEARALDMRGKKNAARNFWPTWRALVNIVVLDDDEDPTVLVWDMPKSVHEDLEAKMKELPIKDRNISSPKKGRDVIVRRKGLGPTDTDYQIELAPPTPASEEVMKLLDEDDSLFNLDAVYTLPDYSVIEGYLSAPETHSAADPFEDEDEDDDDEVPVRRALPAPSRRTVEDEDEDEDDEPVTVSRTASARARLAASLEEDDDD